MTGRQFASYRRDQLGNFEKMLKIAEETHADEKLVELIKEEVEKAHVDIRI